MSMKRSGSARSSQERSGSR
ncbi:hypothetical protein P4O66_008217 [Electrophorus voltai]|uniref:Uncharacterized protein n=1 Tax=Electrophorus voltai TaxID=2609070 RepID=A0AAD8ZE70_9TELE|nr:hypothetical protein P4O66_008217 [Electrophorus voltai]